MAWIVVSMSWKAVIMINLGRPGFVVENFQDLKTVLIRQTDVQNDDVRQMMPEHRDALGGRRSALHGVPFFGEKHLQGFENGGFVIDDKYLGHRHLR